MDRKKRIPSPVVKTVIQFLLFENLSITLHKNCLPGTDEIGQTKNDQTKLIKTKSCIKRKRTNMKQTKLTNVRQIAFKRLVSVSAA